MLEHSQLSEPKSRISMMRIGSRLLTLLLAGFFLTNAFSGQSVSDNFRLDSQTSLMGAGRGESASFSLRSCVDNAISGISASTSFRMNSGCLSLVQASVESRPPPPAVTVEPFSIPTLGEWFSYLLILLMGLLAVPFLAGNLPKSKAGQSHSSTS
jgi:hypothetical protein